MPWRPPRRRPREELEGTQGGTRSSSMRARAGHRATPGPWIGAPTSERSASSGGPRRRNPADLSRRGAIRAHLDLSPARTTRRSRAGPHTRQPPWRQDRRRPGQTLRSAACPASSKRQRLPGTITIAAPAARARRPSRASDQRVSRARIRLAAFERCHRPTRPVPQTATSAARYRSHCPPTTSAAWSESPEARAQSRRPRRRLAHPRERPRRRRGP